MQIYCDNYVDKTVTTLILSVCDIRYKASNTSTSGRKIIAKQIRLSHIETDILLLPCLLSISTIPRSPGSFGHNHSMTRLAAIPSCPREQQRWQFFPNHHHCCLECPVTTLMPVDSRSHSLICLHRHQKTR